MKGIFRILTIALFLVIGVNANAQIKTKILGVTIGVSTKNAVYDKLINQGYGLSTSPQSFDIQNAEYAGYKWSNITFFLLNNVLYKVVFYNPTVPGESYYSDNRTPKTIIFENIRKVLSSKYEKYTKDNIFSDGTTQIRFEPNKMIYENIKLAKKADNATYDDL